MPTKKSFAFLSLTSPMKGTVESTELPSLDGLELGQLTSHGAGDDVTLQIGSHELAGRRVRLAKPLVVTSQRRVVESAVDGAHAGAIDVMGVVRTKLVFKVWQA